MANWYGIEGIKFIYINDFADPLIEWQGQRFSCYIVEDTMWERYTDEHGEDADAFGGFVEYMQDNADDVKELCDLVVEEA